MNSKKLSPQHGTEHTGGQQGSLLLRMICLIYRRYTLMGLFTINSTIKNIMSLYYCHKNPSVLILNIAKIGEVVGTNVKVTLSSFGVYLSIAYRLFSKLIILNRQPCFHLVHRLLNSPPLRNRPYHHQYCWNLQQNEKDKSRIIPQGFQSFLSATNFLRSSSPSFLGHFSMCLIAKSLCRGGTASHPVLLWTPFARHFWVHRIVSGIRMVAC